MKMFAGLVRISEFLKYGIYVNGKIKQFSQNRA